MDRVFSFYNQFTKDNSIKNKTPQKWGLTDFHPPKITQPWWIGLVL